MILFRLRTLPLAAALCLAILTAAACTKSEQATEAETVSGKNAPPKIEARPGWKYYVGGPVMVPDGYGRYRMGDFKGEVSKPSSRGFLIGVKRDGDKFELATWVNGSQMIEGKGFVDEHGVHRFSEKVGFDAKGRVQSKQYLTYDDEREIEASKLEYFDPETGELVHTVDAERPYRPTEDEEEIEDDKEFFGSDEEE